MYRVITDYPVALDSPDHLKPLGTKYDCYSNPSFCDRIVEHFGGNVSALDLGCSGGCLVLDFIDKKQNAVGLEGSDYSLLRKRDAWGVIPDNLFTCDIGKPFNIFLDGKPTFFNVITGWDVFEHLRKEELPTLFKNIINHLKLTGIVVATIPFNRDEERMYHQTVEGRDWWLDLAKNYGLVFSEKLHGMLFPASVRPFCPAGNFFVWERKHEI